MQLVVGRRIRRTAGPSPHLSNKGGRWTVEAFCEPGGAAAGLAGIGGAGALATPDWLMAAAPRRGLGTQEDPIRLNANENALGVCEAARNAAIESLVDGNRYPGDYRGPLTEALAKLLGVETENLVLGNGSTEVIQMAVQAAAGPNAPLVIAEPTFEDVARYQRPFSFDVRTVPLDAHYAHDVGRMRETVEAQRRPTVVYLCSPNNPTGTITPSAAIDEWIESASETTTFLIDEAYYEFVEDPSYWTALEHVHDRPNVIVARTFSKIYAMAGLRLGYAIAHPDTALRLSEFMASNNASVVALAAGVASLTDADMLRRSRESNARARAITMATLDELGIDYLPSHTNFMMHRIHGDLEAYNERMREAGFQVGRPFPPMTDHSRVSFGLPEEMERCSETLRSFRAKGWI